MTRVPSYPKVLTLGSPGTEDVTRGEYFVQEKIDGSQFRFGYTRDGEFGMASHHQQIDLHTAPSMFAAAVEWVQANREYIHIAAQNIMLWDVGEHPEGVWFYGEFLSTPRQNALAYQRVPKGHIMLFDIGIQPVVNGPCSHWLAPDSDKFLFAAQTLDLETVPILATGKNADLSDVSTVPQITSVLGNEIIEGVVIKNYNRYIYVGSHAQPIFAKVVRPSFKETHKVAWSDKTPAGRVTSLIAEYASNEARWRKAVQYMAEMGELQREPRDIGALCKIVAQDVMDEAEDEVKDELWRIIAPELRRVAVRGLPEWYKERLVEGLNA